MSKPRRERREVDGWLVLDKPTGLTSTAAVSKLRYLTKARKAGHAGTLDPLATGVLPIAFGEATKTVPHVMDGEKAYRFTVAWGAATDTDDSEGAVIERSDERPTEAAVRAALPAFTGRISQVPPQYSALKVDGERAYDLARDGETVLLAARPVEVRRLELVESGPDHAVLEADCGKGTYVRALARDLGRVLGCLGHVTQLRRTRVGPFLIADAAPMDALADDAAVLARLLGVERGLSELTHVAVGREAAARLRRGQGALLRGAGAPLAGPAYATLDGVVVALGEVREGALVPSRVFNLALP